MTRYILWSADFEGVGISYVEGPNLLEALRAAGEEKCRLWLESGGQAEPIMSSDGPVPGAWTLGDDAAFDMDNKAAMAELGRSLVGFIIDSVADDLMPMTLK